MENIDKLLAQIGEVLKEEFSKNIKELEDFLQKDEMKTYLQEAIQKGVDKAALSQRDYGKGSIKYISFSLLISSIISEKYSFAINLYDENFYLDEIDVVSRWDLMGMAKFVDSDLDKAEKYLRQKQLPFSESTLIEVKKAQAILYIFIYIQWLKTNIETVVETLNTKYLKSHKQLDITFGLYYENHEKIYSWEVPNDLFFNRK